MTQGKILIVLLSATVSAITTVLVEYIAKPRLEARKQRFIRDRQQIDEVIFRFQKASMSINAIPDDGKLGKSKIFVRFQKIQLENARAALYELLDAFSKLSSKYAERHKEHISKSCLFIGFLLANVESKVDNNKDVSSDKLKDIASELPNFDVYYRAHVELLDNQERWWKRLVWDYLFKTEYADKVASSLKRYDLDTAKK